MGLFIGPLCAVVARHHSIIIKVNPLGLLIEPVAHWDVEVGDLPIVEYEAGRGFVEGSLVMEYALFEVVDAILVSLGGNTGAGLMTSNGLEKAVGDASE
jgi:hypothetical protein